MKKGDLIILLVVLVIMAAIGIGYKLYLNKVGDERVVNIYIKNELYKSVKLTEETNEVIHVVQTIDGKEVYNVVHIFNNGVKVEEANCPNQDDVKQGFIKYPGMPIICLPHNLTIVIEGGTSLTDDIAI